MRVELVKHRVVASAPDGGRGREHLLRLEELVGGRQLLLELLLPRRRLALLLHNLLQPREVLPVVFIGLID